MSKTSQLLERVKQFCIECNATNSSLDKIEVIKRFPDLKEIFRYTYDEINFQYNVTAKNIKKLENSLVFSNVASYADSDIFALLNDLNNRIISGHIAIATIQKFIEEHKLYEDIILNIIDRNLKTRADKKLINKVFPGCIPVFELELANDYDEKLRKKIDWNKQVWLASRKCDGIRLCVKILPDGQVLTLGRSGKEFFTLNVIMNKIRECSLIRNVVFDGEVGLVNPQGADDFQGILSEIRRKNHTIENPRFSIFNFIPLEEFDAAEGPSVYLDRLSALSTIIPQNHPNLFILNQIRVVDDLHLEQLKKSAAENGWEGLILRRGDLPYEGKRSNNLLKVKSFFDSEYRVIRAEMGTIRFIDKTTGLEKEETMLSNVVIEHKGSPVSIGSGFKLEERQQFFRNPELIVGKVITVKYFEETTDQNGKLSLRFPTCKAIHGDKREV